MSGMTDLPTLLASMCPRLQPGRFVFVTVSDLFDATGLDPVGIFRESEAVTAICRVEHAHQARLDYESCYRLITLQVHSALETVGFLAAVSSALARAGIPCNVFSAFYHDHLFVPEALAEATMAELDSLGGQ
ncbi:MAG: ACT domain-containing protein [Chthoniobacterales bacterium]